MNIYDISKKAGVSIATVSRVLNGSDKVSDATRQKVLAVIAENKYTPNAFARSLGLNSMSTVGILCSDSSDVYQAQAIYYLERELRNNSYASMLCCTGHQLQEKQKYLQLLLSRNVDAVIFIGSHFIEESSEKNSYILETAKKIPVFILNGSLEGNNIYSILCDDYMASKEITDFIFSTGSTLPIYLYRSLNYSGKKKVGGFIKSCENHNISEISSHIFHCPNGLENASSILEKLQTQNFFFDAIITADDEIAAGAVKYALHNHIKIPDTLQVTGYNNSILSTCSTPEITTIDNRVEFMCVTTVSLMMQVFQGRSLPSKTMFSGSIIHHNTTKFPIQ